MHDTLTSTTPSWLGRTTRATYYRRFAASYRSMVPAPPSLAPAPGGRRAAATGGEPERGQVVARVHHDRRFHCHERP